MRILALEPYAALSHMSFLDGLVRASNHDFTVWTLPARKWKWRMRTASIEFARRLSSESEPFDLWFASDYTNLAELRGIVAPQHRDTPSVLYFHENQISYPLAEHDRIDHHFGMTHFHDVIAARAVWFNSQFHRREFFEALEPLLKLIPDVQTSGELDGAIARAEVMPIGTDLAEREPKRCSTDRPVRIAWNHRWEYDKDPATLAAACERLSSIRQDFELHLFGQRFRTEPPEFAEMAKHLGARLVDHGFMSRERYLDRLGECDVVLSTALHEFFGIGSLEALRLGLYPVWPNDLAYPELVPDHLHETLLYERSGGIDALTRALGRALDAVQSPSVSDARRELVASTERYHWSRLGPNFDAAFDRVHGVAD